MHYLFTAILICDNCHFSMCVTKTMAESNKKSKRKPYSSSRKDVGGHKFLLSKQANEYMSLHSLFTPQSLQSDSKSGADNTTSDPSLNDLAVDGTLNTTNQTNSDIPSNISDTDVTSGSIGSPVQENVVALIADYVSEPTTQKQTKTPETITTIIDDIDNNKGD